VPSTYSSFLVPSLLVTLLSRESGFMQRACPSLRLSVCLSPKYKNAILSKTKQFRAMVYIDDLAIGSRTWAFQRTHYWCPKIQDGCLVFEKIAFFLQFGDRQTNRWTRPSHEAALAVASGGLRSNLELWCLLTTYRKSYMGFSKNPLLDP